MLDEMFIGNYYMLVVASFWPLFHQCLASSSSRILYTGSACK